MASSLMKPRISGTSLTLAGVMAIPWAAFFIVGL
jgi:hypothetical protein